MEGFRHVPLTDQQGCPIGVVSMRDIIAPVIRATVSAKLRLAIAPMRIFPQGCFMLLRAPIATRDLSWS